MELVFILGRSESYRVLALIWTALITTASYAQHGHHVGDVWPPENLPELIRPTKQTTSITLTTDVADAQLYFNYGLLALHSFSYLQADRAFTKATKLDPALGMAYWGKAYARLGIGKTDQKLDALVTEASDRIGSASKIEKLYIEALVAYTRSENDYRVALQNLIERHPDQLDAKLLLALSLNDGYDSSGNPQGGQFYAKTILEPLLSKYPNHIGTHHYWIHAVEASNYPERANASAKLLEQHSKEFGHIAHMPGHIAWLNGEYERAAKHFGLAEVIDCDYLDNNNISPEDYWSYFHNMAYLLVAQLESGNVDDALETKARVERRYATKNSSVGNASLDQFQSNYGSQIYSRAGNWTETYSMLSALSLTGLGHKIRTMHSRILSLLNRDFEEIANTDIETANAWLTELQELVDSSEFSRNDPLIQTLHYEAMAVVDAFNGNSNQAVENFRTAIRYERNVTYEEPPLRVRTVYELAGQTFCYLKSYSAGITLYKQALEASKKNGYAIQGLTACLNEHGNNEEADFYQSQLNELWATSTR